MKHGLTYFVKDYTWGENKHVGHAMEVREDENAVDFFRAVSKGIYDSFFNNGDTVSVIVWKGAYYVYDNPQDIVKGIYRFRSEFGNYREYRFRFIGIAKPIRKVS